MSEKEKKKMTIVFKTSRGVLHFYGRKEELLNSIAKGTILKLQITQGLTDPMVRASMGSGDLSEPGISPQKWESTCPAPPQLEES